MKFALIPLLNKMEEFYLLPQNRQRFNTYLDILLDETKKDIALPIAAFNPMGKELVLKKIRELMNLETEPLISELIDTINLTLPDSIDRKINLAVNLVDDVGGAWSNKYTTDFSSKFGFESILKRNFCLPYFWTSEKFSEELVVRRTREYMLRTQYWLDNKKPETLREHLDQEVCVQTHLNLPIGNGLDQESVEVVEKLFKENRDSIDYGFIFNFFYGDEACEALGYITYGFPKNAGFKYATHVAGLNKKIT
jgi:hypothetical protein